MIFELACFVLPIAGNSYFDGSVSPSSNSHIKYCIATFVGHMTSGTGSQTVDNPNNKGNVAQGAQHWRFWDEVPVVGKFGSSMSRAEFMRDGKYQGRYMALLHQLGNLHAGEVIEVSGDWQKVEGYPPEDAQFWHWQFARTKAVSDLMNGWGAAGGRAHWHRKQKAATPAGRGMGLQGWKTCCVSREIQRVACREKFNNIEFSKHHKLEWK